MYLMVDNIYAVRSLIQPHMSSSPGSLILMSVLVVQELYSKGYSQREISQTLQVELATVNRDISYLRNQAHISKDTLISGCQKNREMSDWTDCDYKRSMEYG